MKTFEVRMSKKLWEIPCGFSSCGSGAHCIPGRVEAENPWAALRKAVSKMEIEWSYDLEGESIEIVDGKGALRYTFARNPRYESLNGEFEYRGLVFSGKYEETQVFDCRYPVAEDHIVITYDEVEFISTTIWPWMPDWVIDSILDYIVESMGEEAAYRACGRGTTNG